MKPALRDLIGRTVKYICPEAGFHRYGILKTIYCRVKDNAPPPTDLVIRVKRKTVKGVSIEMPNGKIQYVPEANVIAWVYYKVERPLDWRPQER